MMIKPWSYLIAVMLSLSTTHAAIDDYVCQWSLWDFSCMPSALCSYQYQFGDLTPSQSCRLTKGAYKVPQQMHVAYAGGYGDIPTGTAITVSWATFDPVDDSTIWIGNAADRLELVAPTALTMTRQSYYTDGEYALYQHHATVSGLTPQTTYHYQVGSLANATLRSPVSTLSTAPPAGADVEFDCVIYGDLGDGKNGEATVQYVNSLADSKQFIYHVGDIAYADNDFLDPAQALGFFYEQVYNKWMNALTPIMNKIPYMVVVGNHEAECHSPSCLASNYKKDRLGNYTAYNARFKMPSNGVLSMWYSFEHGPVHFTSISSETDYPNAPSNAYTLTHKNGNFGNQLKWLEEDLKKADANRKNVPWIIVGMHRPMYHLEHADKDGRPTNDGLALQQALEDLFLRFNVDVVISGHEHSYERQLPIAKGLAITAGVSSDRKQYDMPRAPVYIVTGGAGNSEPNRPPNGQAPWNVMSTATYGVSTLHASRHALKFQYVASTDQAILDAFTITK